MNGIERGKLLRDEIFAAYETKAQDRRPNSLRPSELGHECSRYLWYRFRWADEFETFPGRLLRLFDTGHSQEDRLVADLRRVGAEVYARDPDNPAEQIAMKLMGGHSKGYLDLIGGGVPHSKHEWVLGECKSHNDKSFKALVKDGVEVAKPSHFAQMQIYMDQHGLEEGLYIAVNKNDDDIYCQFIDYNKRYADNLRSKAEMIVFREDAPQRVNNNPTYFKCKFCNAAPVCHGGELPSRSCRTCYAARPITEKEQGDMQISKPEWMCEKHGVVLDLDAQRRGCEDHRFHPDMVKGEPTDDFVYKKEDGSYWTDEGPSGDSVFVPAAE